VAVLVAVVLARSNHGEGRRGGAAPGITTPTGQGGAPPSAGGTATQTTGAPPPTAGQGSSAGNQGQGKGKAKGQGTAKGGSSGRSGPGKPPAGWQSHRNAEARYVVFHPAGWRMVPVSPTIVDFRKPGSSTYLRVDWSDHPKPSALEDWRNQEQAFIRRHTGYQRIRLEPTDYRGVDAAIWEYRYTVGGSLLHGINLNIVNHDRSRAYALNFQTRESDWQAEWPVFNQIRASFRF
jgi:hypothetical protein